MASCVSTSSASSFKLQPSSYLSSSYFFFGSFPSSIHFVCSSDDANRPDSITHAIVRSFASRNDSNPPTRSQDGPTCLAPLLRAGLRHHQPRYSPLHGGLRTILRACTRWPPYTPFQCRTCFWPQCCRRLSRRCWLRPRLDARGCI